MLNMLMEETFLHNVPTAVLLLPLSIKQKQEALRKWICGLIWGKHPTLA